MLSVARCQNRKMQLIQIDSKRKFGAPHISPKTMKILIQLTTNNESLTLPNDRSRKITILENVFDQ